MSLSTVRSVISRIDPRVVSCGAFFGRRISSSAMLGAPSRYDAFVDAFVDAFAPTQPVSPSDQFYQPDPTYREGEPDHRRPRHHHPIRATMRVIADMFIILWALINTIQNWPQEWNAIKDTLIWAYIIAIWVLHHLGVVMVAMAVAMR